MSLFFGLLFIFFGTLQLVTTFKKLKILRMYYIFKFYYPRGEKIKFKQCFKKLLTYDFIGVPDSKKLEYISIRMKYLDFPENSVVEYKGNRIKI